MIQRHIHHPADYVERDQICEVGNKIDLLLFADLVDNAVDDFLGFGDVGADTLGREGAPDQFAQAAVVGFVGERNHLGAAKYVERGVDFVLGDFVFEVVEILEHLNHVIVLRDQGGGLTEKYLFGRPLHQRFIEGKRIRDDPRIQRIEFNFIAHSVTFLANRRRRRPKRLSDSCHVCRNPVSRRTISECSADGRTRRCQYKQDSYPRCRSR